MEKSIVKITWGYIWRFILWEIVISFGFDIILPSAEYDIKFSITGIMAMVDYYKFYFICVLGTSLIGIVLSCKLATSGIKKKFLIDQNNVKQVFICIMIILIIVVAIYIISNIARIDEFRIAIDEMKELPVEFEDKSYEAVIVKEIDNLLNFIRTFVILGMILNIVVILIMIPFEKKMLFKDIQFEEVK